uniref:Fumarase D n=2 Tax=Enterobacteriaceae TaxID=543 RepID=A0A1S6XXN1_ENTCL|nr:hypothetical protein PIMI6_00005 [Enterobacter cloacae]
MPFHGIITPDATYRLSKSRMEYSHAFMRQHEEMCQVVGSIVFALAEAGHDSRRENIVAVVHSEIAETGKREPDQVLYLQLAIDLPEQAHFLPGQGNC